MIDHSQHHREILASAREAITRASDACQHSRSIRGRLRQAGDLRKAEEMETRIESEHRQALRRAARRR